MFRHSIVKFKGPQFSREIVGSFDVDQYVHEFFTDLILHPSAGNGILISATVKVTRLAYLIFGGPAKNCRLSLTATQMERRGITWE